MRVDSILDPSLDRRLFYLHAFSKLWIRVNTARVRVFDVGAEAALNELIEFANALDSEVTKKVLSIEKDVNCEAPF